MIQDKNFSREHFELCRFDERLAGTATTEEEGSPACGLEISVSRREKIRIYRYNQYFYK
jgi:hypothetical protein